MAPRHLHRPIVVLLVGLVVGAVGSTSALAHGGGCPFSHGDGDNHHHHAPEIEATPKRALLPEELAEEEDLKLERFLHEHENDHLGGGYATSGLGLWLSAMGCSLMVSTASLICLVLLPVIFLKGKPSKPVVDSLAMFGAGAMLGDAFLHQLPHAFGGGHSHSHDHSHDHSHGHSHGHSFQDLSVGLSVLGGIVLFLLVEKLVRYIEEISSTNGQMQEHGHHHHHHHHYGYREKLKVDDTSDTNLKTDSSDSETKNTSDVACEKSRDGVDGCLEDEKQLQAPTSLRKRLQTSKTNGDAADSDELDSANPASVKENVSSSGGSSSSESSLVFGYLNLFSDGVHNFTDGMALGSAFLLYGSMGGWSRTLFLLAHELPQEIGDFGILIRSGFTVSKAIFFNFLSALVALLGTALALVLGKDPGHSSLIEGFTAGGFIYIAVAGVLPEMNSGGTTSRSTIAQLISLTLGVGVALSISLAE